MWNFTLCLLQLRTLLKLFKQFSLSPHTFCVPIDHSHQPALECPNCFFSCYADRAYQDTWQTWQLTPRIQPSTCPRTPFTEYKASEEKPFTAFKALARHSRHICLMYCFLFPFSFCSSSSQSDGTAFTSHLPSIFFLCSFSFFCFSLLKTPSPKRHLETSPQTSIGICLRSLSTSLMYSLDQGSGFRL